MDREYRDLNAALKSVMREYRENIKIISKYGQGVSVLNAVLKSVIRECQGDVKILFGKSILRAASRLVMIEYLVIAKNNGPQTPRFKLHVNQ